MNKKIILFIAIQCIQLINSMEQTERYVENEKYNKTLIAIKKYAAEKNYSDEQAACHLNTPITTKILTLQYALCYNLRQAKYNFFNLEWLIEKYKDKIDFNFTYNRSPFSQCQHPSLLEKSITDSHPMPLKTIQWVLEKGVQPTGDQFRQTYIETIIYASRYSEENSEDPNLFKNIFAAFLNNPKLKKPPFDLEAEDDRGNTHLLNLLSVDDYHKKNDSQLMAIYEGTEALLKAGANVLYVNDTQKYYSHPIDALSLAKKIGDEKLIKLIEKYRNIQLKSQ